MPSRCFASALLVAGILLGSVPAQAASVPFVTTIVQACIAGLSSFVGHKPLSAAERAKQRALEWRRFEDFSAWWYAKDGSYHGPRSISRDELPTNMPQVFAKYLGEWQAKLPPGTKLDPQSMANTVYDLRDFTHDPRRFFKASQSVFDRIEARAYEKGIKLEQAFGEVAQEILAEGGFPTEIVWATGTSYSQFRKRLTDGKLFYDATLKKTSFHGANYHLWEWLTYIQDRKEAGQMPPNGQLRAVFMAFGHNPAIEEFKWGNEGKSRDSLTKYSPWYHLLDYPSGRGFFHPEIGNLWLRYYIRGMSDVLSGRPFPDPV